MMALTLASCAPEVPKSLDEGATTVTDPVITNLTYTKNSSTQTESAPFTVARNIYPDMNTGFCAVTPNSAEVTLNGTYDSVGTDHLTFTGPMTQQISHSGDTFSIKFCIAPGSVLLSLKAVDAKGNSSSTLKISVLNFPTLSTLAAGHPQYPSPGFRTLGVSTKTASQNGGTVKSRSFSVGEHSTQTILSTGNTSLTMEVGFVNIIKQENP